jgi:hypothetical protein
VICPYCKTDNDKIKTVINGLKVYCCTNCNNIFSSELNDHEISTKGMPLYNVNNIITPNFKIGDCIMCVDNKHPLFLQDGFVKELDHLHARILFKKDLVWMNQNVIAKL